MGDGPGRYGLRGSRSPLRQRGPHLGVLRLAEDRFLVLTTTGGAARRTRLARGATARIPLVRRSKKAASSVRKTPPPRTARCACT